MERITRREEGEVFWNGKDYCEDAQDLCENYNFDCSTCPLGMALERLCQYEDTGIEPEMISVLVSRYISDKRRERKIVETAARRSVRDDLLTLMTTGRGRRV